MSDNLASPNQEQAPNAIEDLSPGAPPRDMVLMCLLGITSVNRLRSKAASEAGLQPTVDAADQDIDRWLGWLRDNPMGRDPQPDETITIIETGHLERIREILGADRIELRIGHDETNDDHRIAFDLIRGDSIRFDWVDVTSHHISLPSDEVDSYQQLCGQLAEFVLSGHSLDTTAVNLVSGFGLAKTVLPMITSSLGVQAVYPDVVVRPDHEDPMRSRVTVIDPLRLDLSFDATAGAHDAARLLAQRSALGGNNTKDLAGQVNRLGLAAYVAIDNHELTTTGFGEAVLELAARETPNSYSMGATVLDLFADWADETDSRRKVARDLSKRLATRASEWVDRRLWSLNLVPEMVLHDDRHVQRVDRLAAMLSWPLLFEGTISPRDVFDLSAAAWLHDWGHVGAFYGTDGEGRRFVSHPLEVRLIHGELTRQLLLSSAAQVGLDRTEASRVGLLCAHHQGKTCCGLGVPAPEKGNGIAKLAAELGRPLPTLEEDLKASRWTDDTDYGSLATLDRVQLLTLLLRIADGADVGQHRVPHYESADAYLRHCFQKAASNSLRELELIVPDETELLGSMRRAAENPTDADVGRVLTSAIGRHSGEARALLKRAQAYHDYVDEQRSHYEKHRMVSMVGFEHRLVDDQRGWQAIVTPVNPLDADVAVAKVHKDIERELEVVDGNGKKSAMPASVLAEHSLVYRGAVANA